MWLITVLIVYMLTMLTTAHADRGRSTLKDDEQFRNGLVRDLKFLKEKLKLFNTKFKTILYKTEYCLNVSLNCTAKCYSKPLNLKTVVNTIQDERKTLNIDTALNVSR